ncbi:MAG: terpene cyclase/mutase family protein [Planctomycetes bacterium]|nr:terpene cyclase/mutase family protein [Planctomycetota bacterium]
MKRLLLIIALGLLGLACLYLSRDKTLFLMFSNHVPASKKDWTKSDRITKEDVLAAQKSALKYLFNAQDESGSWADHPGFTAISLKAILQSSQYDDGFDKQIIQAVNYLLTLQREDGAFAIPFSTSTALTNYTTSLCLQVLVLCQGHGIALTPNKLQGSAAFIKKAQDYLIGIQKDEGEGFTADHPNYGGVSYGAGGGADLSNMHLSLQALKDSGLDANDPYFKKALSFVTRCQDSETNDQKWSGGSGGFAYSSEGDASDEKEVYGAMGFAGLKSLLLCQVGTEDQRLQDVLLWLKDNYSVYDHPGKGQISIYYYFATMAKAFSLAEENGVNLDVSLSRWRDELMEVLVKRQRVDGSWVNDEKKYMEGQPILATAYGLYALNICSKE